MTGVPLLSDALANGLVAVEIAFGADLTALPATWSWTDVTALNHVLYTNPVTIAAGRGDESSQAQPARCSFALLNPTGEYTAYNPLSSHWPYVRKGTPVRVRVSLDGGSTWYTRFFGYANGFTPGWDKSCKVSTSVVSASGILRRLAQGTNPLRSTLTRAILAADPANLGQYWPCEDSSGATQAASALAGGTPMVESGAVSFAALDTAKGLAPLGWSSVLGTQPLPNLKDGGSLSATFAAASASSWVVQIGAQAYPGFGVHVTTVVAEWATPGGTYVRWRLTIDYVSPVNTRLSVVDPGGTETTLATYNVTHSGFSEYRIQAQQSGGNVLYRLDGPNGNSDTGSYAGTLTGVTSVTANPDAQVTAYDFAVGHVRVWNGTAAPVFQTALDQTTEAWWAYVGETPGDRLTRLCAEQGVPFEIVGTYSTSVAMGAQGADTFLNLVHECETTDAGLVYDGLSVDGGLSYEGISDRYNGATGLTLDFAAGQVDEFGPTDDDQGVRNKVKASRKGGSSAEAVDTSGALGTDTIGVYESSVTTNEQDDTRLPFRAQWEVHKGTVEGFRYPTLGIDLRAAPTLATDWVRMLPGWHLDVTNVSDKASQHPPETVELVLEGWSETITPKSWTAGLNCAPFAPYEVVQVESSTYGRVQTGGSTLAANASAGATSLSVASPGVLWTTAAGDFPFDVWVDGIRVTVTNITGATSPQTFTVTGSTVTKALTSGAVVRLWHRAVIRL